MTQSSRTLFQRIRCIKSSLDKAEQSFMDNKDIRGELDLMLAEAELKNLRRKKDRPWSWNRQVLAGCAAVLLVVAGLSRIRPWPSSSAAGALPETITVRRRRPRCRRLWQHLWSSRSKKCRCGLRCLRLQLYRSSKLRIHRYRRNKALPTVLLYLKPICTN